MIAAVLNHCSEATTEDDRHKYFPCTSDSWCKFQADIANNMKTYKRTPGLQEDLRKIIEPVFRDLSSDTLLSKSYTKTKNNNEALNGIIWQRCPKDIYVRQEVLEMGVSSAIIYFNDGTSGVGEVMNKLGLLLVLTLIYFV